MEIKVFSDDKQLTEIASKIDMLALFSHLEQRMKQLKKEKVSMKESLREFVETHLSRSLNGKSGARYISFDCNNMRKHFNICDFPYLFGIDAWDQLEMYINDDAYFKIRTHNGTIKLINKVGRLTKMIDKKIDMWLSISPVDYSEKFIQMEAIEQACIFKNDKYYLGKNHATILCKAQNFGLEYNGLKGGEQGYMTTKGRFVDRVEAAKIAWINRQTKSPVGQLYDEDLIKPKS